MRIVLIFRRPRAYPPAETAEGRLDSLDPETFEYEIIVREIQCVAVQPVYLPPSCKLHVKPRHPAVADLALALFFHSARGHLKSTG